MPRNFVGKKTKPTEYLLQNALKEVLSGKLSIRKAAEVFGLKRSTVGFYSKRHSSCGLLPPKKVKRPQHPSQIIPAKLEDDLAKYLQSCSTINHGMTTIETRKLAYSFAIANQITVPSSWTNKESASEDWMSGFMKRNKSLSIRKPEKTSQARAAGFNKPVVSIFYDKLSEVCSRYNFQAHEIYNADESGNQTVMQPPNVIATKGTKQVNIM